MSDRALRELCLNFVERMRAHKMHDLAAIRMDKRQERETRMIEFFTGAYVALRQVGRSRDAEAVGVFTATILARGGYGACCAAAGVHLDPKLVTMVKN